MSDRAARFANVLDQPADDTARLVLADWLQENGEEDFGQFIRAGVVASRFRDRQHIGSPDYSDALAHIAAYARGGKPAACVASLGLGPYGDCPRVHSSIRRVGRMARRTPQVSR